MVYKPSVSEKPRYPRQKPQQSIEISNFLAHHDIVVEYLCHLLNDCHTLLPSYDKLHLARDIDTLRRRFSQEGLSFATKTLPSYFDSVLRYLEHGVSDFPGFKKRSGCTYPVFLQQLVAPIFEKPYDDVTAKYMKCLYQFCVAFKKLEGPYKKSTLDHELAEFKRIDRELPNQEVVESDVELDSILCVASAIMTEIFEGFDPFDRSQAQNFLPGPGPGATNTPTLPNVRFRPHVAYAQTTEIFPLNEWYNHTSVAPQCGKFDLRVGKRCLKHCTKDAKASTSRFTFVPKTYAKPRGICIEQLEMQWMQQAIRKGMYKWIENHPRTSGFVSFTDQSINASLALRSSGDLELATIDMSAASDRIPLWLVTRLFAGNPKLLKALLACRTDVIEFEKRSQEQKFKPWIRPNKFAPMGSALCFPVMGIVHFTLLRAILLLNRDRQLQSDLNVWVYGDDIILRTPYVSEVYRLLPKFGMKLNEGKSYSHSHFRESCGCHAYNGIDITPTRFKTIVKFPASNDDLLSALSNESDFFKKGYAETAAFIRQQILHLKQFRMKYAPTVTNESQVLGWIREPDALIDFDFSQVKRRWNCDLQRFEYRLRYIHNVGEKLPVLKDEEAYLRCLVQHTQTTVSITERDGVLCVKATTSKDVGEILPKKQLRSGWFDSSALRPRSAIMAKIGKRGTKS